MLQLRQPRSIFPNRRFQPGIAPVNSLENRPAISSGETTGGEFGESTWRSPIGVASLRPRIAPPPDKGSDRTAPDSASPSSHPSVSTASNHVPKTELHRSQPSLSVSKDLRWSMCMSCTSSSVAEAYTLCSLSRKGSCPVWPARRGHRRGHATEVGSNSRGRLDYGRVRAALSGNVAAGP
jgi:hypothetical protein